MKSGEPTECILEVIIFLQVSKIMLIFLFSASKPPTISTPKFNGDFVPKPTMTQVAHSKFEHIRAWSVNTYKCTKQLLSEKLGKSSRTVDLELEAQIEVLRDTQRKYTNILRLSRALMTSFSQVVQTQRALGEAFSEQSQRSVELQDEFTYNSETQRALVKNGETLLCKCIFLHHYLRSLVSWLCTVKPVLSGHSKRTQKIGFQD